MSDIKYCSRLLAAIVDGWPDSETKDKLVVELEQKIEKQRLQKRIYRIHEKNKKKTYGR